MMDETGLWNGNVSFRSFVDHDTFDDSIAKCSMKQWDTGAVAVSATRYVFSNVH